MKVKLVDMLEKVFPDAEPPALSRPLRGFVGERVCVQAAVLCEGAPCAAKVSLRSDARCELREVGLVPVGLACYDGAEGDYLRRERGLYPDPLLPTDGTAALRRGEWKAFWLDLYPSAAGRIKSTFSIDCGEGELSLDFDAEIIDAELPPQRLYYTNWFHYDALANFYGLDMWSPKYFETLGKWLRNYARLGGNVLLTPLFTPPLDTARGGERRTAQLVGAERAGDEWRFDFSLLEKFVALARSCGVANFEFSHLFSQWGAECAPKIVDSNGERIFGWETPVLGDEYRNFLSDFLPALRAEVDRLGLAKNCFLHVSDEPTADQLSGYLAAKKLLRAGIADLPIIDAISHYEFVESGAVERPVASLDHIEPFIAHKTPHLWGYYCCSQSSRVSNRFIAQSSYQNRAFAAPTWKCGLEGFLQWGHNFYNTQLSTRPLDPWLETDAGGAFPSGDPFVVYPGADGEPVESLRAAVFFTGLCDTRAFDLCAEKLGREQTLELIEADGAVSFSRCDRLCGERRARVDEAISAAL